jgi:hypothetical protein
MPRRTQALAIVLAAGLVAAGCGGGDDKGGKAAATTAKTTTAATTTQPGAEAAPAGSAEEAAQRLRAGGYTVSKLDVNPPAIAARKVGDHVLLYEYTTPDEAKKGEKLIKDAVTPQRNRGIVETEGRLVYFLGYPHPITASERAAFADLVDVGEGRPSP